MNRVEKFILITNEEGEKTEGISAVINSTQGEIVDQRRIELVEF